MPYTYDYPRPAVTVDIILFARREGRWHVLLTRRGREPFAGRWALPGGFVDENEDLPDAAARELEEETGLSGLALTQGLAYGRPGRDPRGWTITIAFYAALDRDPPAPRAGDDAAAAQWLPLDELPALAFDHDQIIADCARAALEEVS